MSLKTWCCGISWSTPGLITPGSCTIQTTWALKQTQSTKWLADAVLHLKDGRYALIEIKTGANRIPDVEASLLKFSKLIANYNEKALNDPEHPRAIYRKPDALVIICATAPMAYTTENGVKVVPIGCLRD